MFENLDETIWFLCIEDYEIQGNKAFYRMKGKSLVLRMFKVMDNV